MLKKSRIILNHNVRPFKRILIGILIRGMLSMCLVVPYVSFADTGEQDDIQSNPSLFITDTPQTADENNENIQPAWRVVRMRVTAYCPCSKCCGEYADGITACNHLIQNGDRFVAADRTYAFGTEMVIPGYNNSQPVEVKDRGGAIQGDRLDVFFNTHQEALEWGVQYLDVLIKNS